MKIFLNQPISNPYYWLIFKSEKGIDESYKVKSQKK